MAGVSAFVGKVSAVIAILLAVLSLIDWFLSDIQKAAFSSWTLSLWNKLDDLTKQLSKEWTVTKRLPTMFWLAFIGTLVIDLGLWIYYVALSENKTLDSPSATMLFNEVLRFHI